MSILSAPSARPDRIFSLVSLVRTLGPLDEASAFRMLVPRVQATRLQGRADVSPDRARETSQVARSLGLLRRDDEGRLSVPEGIPATRRGLADYLHTRLVECAGQEDPDGLILRGYAWFVVWANAHGRSGCNLTSAQIVAESTRILDPESKGGEGRAFNTTKVSPWKDWMVFLGLGHASLPGFAHFVPDPSRRLIDVLPRIVARETEVPAKDFLATISRELPYLDGGALFQATCAVAQSFPPAGELSWVLSSALRSLHQGGNLRLHLAADQIGAVRLRTDPLNPVNSFTHVSLKSNPTAGRNA